MSPVAGHLADLEGWLGLHAKQESGWDQVSSPGTRLESSGGGEDLLLCRAHGKRPGDTSDVEVMDVANLNIQREILPIRIGGRSGLPHWR